MRQDEAGGMNVLNWNGIVFSGRRNWLGPARKDWGPSVGLGKMSRILFCRVKIYSREMGTEEGGVFQSVRTHFKCVVAHNLL